MELVVRDGSSADAGREHLHSQFVPVDALAIGGLLATVYDTVADFAIELRAVPNHCVLFTSSIVHSTQSR